jgi:hypothetical protein
VAPSPPKAKAAVCVPVPPKHPLVVDKLAGDVVQLVPSYSSVAPVASCAMFDHQKLMQLFEYLLLLHHNLAVFKPVEMLKPNYAPLYSSVAPVTGGVPPPNARAAVCVPATS